MSDEPVYSKLTVEGDKRTQWICGCFETADGYFWFCDEHKGALKKTIEAQIDDLDMTRVLD